MESSAQSKFSATKGLDSPFCVGLMYVTSKAARKFVNHSIEELVLTFGPIRPKRLNN